MSARASVISLQRTPPAAVSSAGSQCIGEAGREDAPPNSDPVKFKLSHYHALYSRLIFGCGERTVPGWSFDDEDRPERAALLRFDLLI
jgi:hypothetical protein